MERGLSITDTMRESAKPEHRDRLAMMAEHYFGRH